MHEKYYENKFKKNDIQLQTPSPLSSDSDNGKNLIWIKWKQILLYKFII